MSKYDFTSIEKKWQKAWADHELYRVQNHSEKPKYYALDMFPYPSGAGLHVGHPLGYIASDIVSRYKRLNGYNVLHPMGYDAFGLPAEQYAIQTGQHPATTTENNIATFRRQLDLMGFSFDWSREVRTCDPNYYQWTQWIFGLFFTHYYDKTENKAKSVSALISHFSTHGSAGIDAVCTQNKAFTAEDWNQATEVEKNDILNNYRLAFVNETTVNWCAELGTVLANEEVVNGVSERGGYPVVRKKMKQWALRITAYADRLISGLETIDWTESIKEIQKNWIGRSEGAQIQFALTLNPSPQEEGGQRGEEPMPEYNKKHLKFAKQMRKQPTEAEAAMWDLFRNNQLGVKIRRQQPIDQFICDFVCFSKKLIIEIDGEIHEKQKDYDAQRTEILNGLGYDIIRFTNKEVEENRFSVRDIVEKRIQSIPEKFEEPEENYSEKSTIFIEVFTTRPDTIFGATFMVVAPEYEGLLDICSEEQADAVKQYAQQAKNRSEIDRMADTKKTGVFTGSYCINPFTLKPIPVWVSDYVLAGYGTGAIMAVPAHDERDFEFATTFQLPIIPVIKPADSDIAEPLTEAFSAKDGVCFNSGFLNGLAVKDAVKRAIAEVENLGIGTGKINYKLRDAGFGRQRYWGEPFPIVYNENGIPQLIEELPVELPKVESYKPTGTGESPLAAVSEWVNSPAGKRETDTMPGWAGSSWYFLRYMDPNNKNAFASKEALEYWQQVDLYVGGSEHATGHLLYSRFWTKFLYDLGYISWDEPFKKLVNQGMIGGEDGQKMSKRWGNVVNPDDVCRDYGADTLRLYEMFLGPLTDSKPWNTHGIEGVSRFLGKFWRLFFDNETWAVIEEKATPAELKILHKTIKKITWDIDNMSFNTSVSAFMVATNELGTLKCKKREILEPLLILLAPFAPHITEELWQMLGHNTSIHTAAWPAFNEAYLVENTFTYPISINGKTRTQMEFSLDTDQSEIEKTVLADATVQKWMEGKPLRKIIVVKGRIVNVVV